MVKPGDSILLSDGSIELNVTDTSETDVVTIVTAGGELRSRKGVNVPLHSIDIPAFTEKDRADLEFGIVNGVDIVAQSFVRNAADVRQVREYLHERGSSAPLVAKIENNRAIENIDDILEAVDGIMVARGDLGVETPLERVPILQKTIIAKSNAAGKMVITATHMLKSMVNDFRGNSRRELPRHRGRDALTHRARNGIERPLRERRRKVPELSAADRQGSARALRVRPF